MKGLVTGVSAGFADMRPHVAAVLGGAVAVDHGQTLHKMKSEKFMATDELKTVKVMLDGHRCLVDVLIKDGLLRLGAETVQRRLNEALHNATARASASIEADWQRLDAAFADIAGAWPDTAGP